MQLKRIIPVEIDDILNSKEFDDEAGILIESSKYIDESINVIFSICFDSYNETPAQFWELTAIGVEDEKITREWSQEIGIYEEHVLLLEYNDIQSELYFTGIATNTDALFLDIYKSLIKFSHSLPDVSKYILNVDKLQKDGHGLFARGPKTILDIYSNCLIKHNIKPKFIGEYKPEKKLKLLKLAGSYFIGKHFSFKKLN